MERHNYSIIVGANLAGDNINVHVLSGCVLDSGAVLWSNSHTETYVLENFKNHRSIARAGLSLADMIEKRANSKNGSIKELIEPAWKRNTAVIKKYCQNILIKMPNKNHNREVFELKI